MTFTSALPPHYMGVRAGSTTRAKTSTSTCRAPARSSARAQASTVAPEVSTSSTSSSAPRRDLGLAGGVDPEGALHIGGARGPATARPAAGVALARFRAVTLTGGPPSLRGTPASAADWLKRRAQSRRQCSGTGTMHIGFG